MLAVQADGAEPDRGDSPRTDAHPLQKAFGLPRAAGGFCTPGMLMTMVDCAHESEPDDGEIREESRRACRCRLTGI